MIELQGLNKFYGNLHPVNNISLTIPDNSIFGIIGKSGAGKSTLVRLISLLEKPDSGAVLYNGVHVENLEKKALLAQRRKLGMIFQNFNLFSSRSAAGNVAYPLEIAGVPKGVIKERVAELLSLVGLEDRGEARISTLSGGQKQRVAIARALANKPEILFCDEATSALDPQTTRSILSLIKEIQQKMNLTVVMITHQMEVVRDSCQYVAVLENGVVMEQGTVSDIFTHPQSPVTKDFLSNLAPMEDPETLKLVRWSDDGGGYILRFPGVQTGEPVLSRIAKKFNVEFNIRAGGIQNIDGIPVGTLLTDFSGPEDEKEKVLNYLKESGITVEKNTILEGKK